MASTEPKIAYRQGFRSSKPVTEVLNSFIKTPRRSFVLFSEAEYIHDPIEVIRYDDQANKSVAARIREINDRVTELNIYSKNLAVRTIHLSLPAGGIEDSRGMLLHFSPLVQEATTYWKIIQNLHDDEKIIRTPTEIAVLTQRDLYLGLAANDLRPRASLKLAKQTLGYDLNDPNHKYDFSVENILGLTRSEVTISQLAKESLVSPNHPDIINDEGVI